MSQAARHGSVTEARLARMYADFNDRFFGGRLALYRVCLREVTPGAEIGGMGYTDRKRRRILIYRGIDKNFIAPMLLHEMVHLRTGLYHGVKFWTEMKRLDEAGAPVTFDYRTAEPKAKRKGGK